MATLSEILRRISTGTPSINSIISVPTIPTLPARPLICGANEALAAVDAARSSILAAASSKKSALITLATAAGVAKNKIDAIKEVASNVYSLQNDVVGLLANPTPTQISSFLNRWSKLIPSDEFQIIVEKIDALVSGQATLDFCVDIPNYTINGTTGALSLNARSALTPNSSPTAATALVSSIKNAATQLSSGRSGEIVSDLDDEMNTNVWDALKTNVNDPAKAIVQRKLDAVNSVTGWSSIQSKMLKHGMSASELQTSGFLTSSESSTVAKYVSTKKDYETAVSYQSKLIEYANARIESTGSGQNVSAVQALQTKLKNDHVIDSLGFRSLFNSIDTIVTSNASLLKRWVAYRKNS